jgi:predicted Zn-dependent protease
MNYEEDMSLFVVDHASKLGAGYVDVRLEDHYNELIIVAEGKAQRDFINCRCGIDIRTLVNGALGFPTVTDLKKKGIRHAVEVAFKIAKASSKYVPTLVKHAYSEVYKTSYKADSEKGNGAQFYDRTFSHSGGHEIFQKGAWRNHPYRL